METKYVRTFFNESDIIANVSLAKADAGNTSSLSYAEVASPASPTKPIAVDSPSPPPPSNQQWLPKLVNKKGSNIYLLNSKYLYVGRPTKWGNPFKIDVNNSRALCVAKYVNYIKNSYLYLQLHELLNYDYLVCSCYPSLCHIDGLLKLLKEKYPRWIMQAVLYLFHFKLYS